MRLFNLTIALASSSLLLSAAFFCPTYFFWFVFIFLIPVFYLAFTHVETLTFTTGFWWGLLFFGAHFYGLMVLLHEKAQGQLRLLAGLVLILYCALHAGLWFCITARFIKMVENSIVWKSCCLLLCTQLYFYWLEFGIFWIFGHVNGYCFASPLLTLAHYPKLLMALPILGTQGLFACLCVMQLLLALAIIKKSYNYVATSLIFLIPFLFGVVKNNNVEIPSYVSKLGYVSPPPKEVDTLFDRAEEINTSIMKKIRSNPKTTTILMPESSMYGSLNQHQEILDLWATNALADNNITLIVGSFRTDNQENVFVTLYKLRGSRIINHYDKSFLFPFTEYLPDTYKRFKWIRNLFLKENNDFSTKELSPVFFEIEADCFVQPYLCSDLYYSHHHIKKNNENKPILFAVNDSWFSTSYMKRLMFLFAVFKAIEFGQDVMYVGHSFGAWIDHATGKTINL